MGRVLRYYEKGLDPENSKTTLYEDIPILQKQMGVYMRWYGPSETPPEYVPYMACQGVDKYCDTTCNDCGSCLGYYKRTIREYTLSLGHRVQHLEERMDKVEAALIEEKKHIAYLKAKEERFKMLCTPTITDMQELTKFLVPIKSFQSKTEELSNLQEHLHYSTLFKQSMQQYVGLCEKVGADIPGYSRVLYLNVHVDDYECSNGKQPERVLTAEVRRKLNAATQLGTVSVIALKFIQQNAGEGTFDATRKYQDVAMLHLQKLGFLRIENAGIFEGEYHYNPDDFRHWCAYTQGEGADMGRYYYIGKTPDALAVRLALLQQESFC